MNIRSILPILALLLSGTFIFSCKQQPSNDEAMVKNGMVDSQLVYLPYTPKPTDMKLSRAAYADKLYGFWLAQCIANWTGLVTEMDKIGIPTEEGKGAGFYTRDDWGKPDQPNLWGSNNYSRNIDFVFADQDSIWGADDDTDIEYIYQSLLYNNRTSLLSGRADTGRLAEAYHGRGGELSMGIQPNGLRSDAARRGASGHQRPRSQSEL